jgi:hypothetical protein
MDPRKEKEVRAITSAEVVPDRDEHANVDVERISNYFTIAAAASGFISDGCEFCMSAPKARLTYSIKWLRSELPYEHDQCE